MMGWSAAFTDLPPIKLADGRTLKTLADCRAYVLALPSRPDGSNHPVVSGLLCQGFNSLA